MVISFARRQNVKMIPLDVVSGGFDMVCNGRRVVIFNEGLEVFSCSIMKSSFCFTDVEIIAIPATSSCVPFKKNGS